MNATDLVTIAILFHKVSDRKVSRIREGEKVEVIGTQKCDKMNAILKMIVATARDDAAS